MKKIHYLISLYSVCAFTLNAQTLYTESFDNLATGILSTDTTGTTAGKGGWHVLGGNPQDYVIAPENSKGKVLRFEPINVPYTLKSVFRNDLQTFYNLRDVNNKVLKVSFDLYIGDYTNILFSSRVNFIVYGKNEIILLGLEYRFSPKDVNIMIHDKNYKGVYGKLVKLMYSDIFWPILMKKDSWVTFEMYLDYEHNKAYYSIPMLNYTNVYDIDPVDPVYSVENDDIPYKIQIFDLESGLRENTIKIDNINIVMQNTVPAVNTLGLNQFNTTVFNVHPNPAANVVTISNPENVLIQQIQVYDNTGKLLGVHEFSNQPEVQLNIEDLATGVYMLHIQTNTGVGYSKLIKK